MRINSINTHFNFYNYKMRVDKSSVVVPREFNTSSLQCLANQNMSFCAKKPIYAMDKEFNLKYFSSIQEAAQALEVNQTSIAKVLKQKNHVAGGHTFIFASEAEITDETGKKTIDPQAIKKLKDGFDKAKTVPVYIIDYDGNLKRFESETMAAEFLGVSLKLANKAANNYTYTVGECLVVPAEEVELKDPNGKTILDSNSKPAINYEKVQNELCKFSFAQCAPICTISYLGDITRYENRQELLESGRYSENTVSTCLNSGKPANEVIFVYENEILKRTDKGKTKINSEWNYEYDLDKINKRLQVFVDSKIKPVKVKNVRTREINYFSSASQAAEATGISKQMVSKCLKGEYPFRGYFFQYLYPMYLKDYQVEYFHAK